MTKPTIGCALVTYRAKHHLQRCLPPLLQSPLKPRVLVIDSSSHDGTVELARQMGAETITIPQHEFNHGTTREMARRHLNTDIVTMHTQDAYLLDHHTLEKLIQPIFNNEASASYARQIPHVGADFFETFQREYNYSSTNHIRSIEDIKRYGVYTFFCSDSCAAYRNSALELVGGFPRVLLGEDTVVVAKMLRKGHKVAYVADALVHHSHRYSLLEEFQRNFDTGLARKEYAELLICESSDYTRGKDYVKEMFKRLAKEAPHKLPYGFCHVLAKWLGYSLGSRSVNAPTSWKKTLSSQKFFWK